MPSRPPFFASARGRLLIFNLLVVAVTLMVSGVPTVNGYSGSTPPFWDLNPSGEEYVKWVQRWNGRHEVGHACSYDSATNTWDTNPFD